MSSVGDIKQSLDTVQMELGGKLRTLQFDMNAFAELENRFGSVDKAMEQLASGRMSDVRMILWASLIHEEAIIDDITGEPKGYNITPYQVGSWIKNPQMLTMASQKLTMAMGMDITDPANLPDEMKAELEKQGLKLAEQDAKPKN